MDPLDPVTILISHDGNCYCLSHRSKNIRWSYKMEPPFSYNADKAEDAEDFMDARFDEEEGKISIFHHNKLNPQGIPLPDEYLDQHLSSYSTSDVTQERYEDLVKLRLSSGVPADDDDDDVKVVLHIKRIRYTIVASRWNLQFSIFKASCIWNNDETSPVNVNVWPTLTERNFMDVCQGLNGYTNESGATLADLNLHLELAMMDRIIRSPKLVKGRDELFKGEFNGFEAVVQVFDNIANISSHYNTLLRLQTTPHHNILTFLGANIDVNGKYQFAFEGVDNTMSYFVRCSYPKPKKEDLTNVLRGVVQGILHLHMLNLAHGNLNPWNVLIPRSDIPKLWGLNDCAKLNDELRYREYKKLAKLIIYTFTDQYHPISKDYYMKLKPDYKLMNDAKEAQDVAKKLIQEREKFSNLVWILNHPWMWTCEKRLRFIKDVHELISIRGSPVYRNLIDALAVYCWDTTKGWDSCFNSELIDVQETLPPLQQGTQQGTQRYYDYMSVCHLLRFMRNVHNHQLEIGGKLDQRVCGNFLGKTSAKLEKVFRRAFPNLLLVLYDEVQKQHLEKYLSDYFTLV